MKIIALLLLFLTAFTRTTYADTFGLQISPDKTQLRLLPGSTEKVTYTLTNTSGETATFTPKLYEFRPDGKGDGGIRLSSSKSLKDSQPLIAKYFTLTQNGSNIDTVTLESGATENVILNISIPEAAVQEDLYISLIFSGENSEEEGSSHIIGAVGTNILLTIGDPHPILSISEFTTSTFYWRGPIIFSLSAENNGESLANTQASITIHNMFGRQTHKIKTDQTTILAGSSRQLTQNEKEEITWDPGFLFGRYTATAQISGTQEASATVSFIAIPLLPTIIVIGSLSSIIAIYLRVKRKL